MQMSSARASGPAGARASIGPGRKPHDHSPWSGASSRAGPFRSDGAAGHLKCDFERERATRSTNRPFAGGPLGRGRDGLSAARSRRSPHEFYGIYLGRPPWRRRRRRRPAENKNERRSRPGAPSEKCCRLSAAILSFRSADWRRESGRRIHGAIERARDAARRPVALSCWWRAQVSFQRARTMSSGLS